MEIHTKTVPFPTFSFVIPCQNHRFKHLNFQYIYLISYKIAKKANQRNGFALFEKRYHNLLKRCQNERYIADTCNRELTPIKYGYRLSKRLISLFIKQQQRYPRHGLIFGIERSVSTITCSEVVCGSYSIMVSFIRIKV